ncbi:MAG: HAMP domain-containing sensor histidine kinase [Balneolaceae bacterium]
MNNQQQELERLLNLSDFDLDYGSLEQEFIHLSKLAAQIAGTEISQLNLIDNYVQWSVSQIGTTNLQTPREKTICTYTVEGNTPIEIPDLGKDERFQNFESVKSAGAKYYYGIPLVSKEGFSIGSLCVISLSELKLSKEKKDSLALLAEEVIQRLEVFREINKLKKERFELKTANREIAHDLRGMINGIMGIGDLIEFENKGESREIEKFIKLQKGSCRSMVEYLEDLLETESENGENDFTNLEKLSSKLERLYSPLAVKKGIDFKVSINEKHDDVQFESSKILQILGNLVSNAMKFTPQKGEVYVDLKLIKTTKNNEKINLDEFRLKILVSDSGVGMSKEKIDEILRNRAISTKGTIGEKGFGLGLNLVQHHIEKLNGSFDIESDIENGSTFKVTIPVNTLVAY